MGNHEIERTLGNVGTDMPMATPTTFATSYSSGSYIYQAYAARFPNGKQAATTPAAGGFGDINSAMELSAPIRNPHPSQGRLMSLL